MKVKKEYYLLTVIIFMALIGCSKEPSKNNIETANKVDASKAGKFEMSSKQKKVMTFLISNELETFLTGGDALSSKLLDEISGGYTAVSANELQKEYERNEVAADMKFRKKLLLVNGTVKSIDRSVGENYFISLKGGSNPFMQPKASIADGNIEFMAQLNKGNPIQLMCIGDGMLIGSAMLAKCVPSLVFARNITNNYVDNFNSELTLSNKNHLTQVFVLSLVFTSLLPADSVCFSDTLDSKKCSEEIPKVLKNKSEFVKALEETSVSLNIPKDDLKKYF